MCLAPGGQPFEPDCRQCHDPEKRLRWGCDVEAAEPLTVLAPCPFCRGGEPGCTECHGDDEIPIRRCPNRLVTQREIDAISAALMVERGVLPSAGGWDDQAATFVRAYPLITREIAHWQSVAAERARREAEAAARRK